MGISTYMRGKLHDAALRHVSYTCPNPIYLALYTTDPGVANTGSEVSAADYVRKAVAFNATDALGNCVTTSVVSWTTPTNAWGTISHWALMESLTGGNLLFSGQMDIQSVVAVGEPVSVPAGYIKVRLGA